MHQMIFALMLFTHNFISKADYVYDSHPSQNEINYDGYYDDSYAYWQPKKPYYDDSWLTKYWKQSQRKQFEQAQVTASQLALLIGIVNAMLTGLAYNQNSETLKQLETKATYLERILSSTCDKVFAVTSITGTPGDSTANAAILQKILDVTNPTCST